MPLSTLIFIIFTLLVSTLLPIGLTIFLCLKYKVSFFVIFVSSFTFLVIESTFRIPLLDLILKQSWYTYLDTHFPMLNFILIGLISGIFIEVGRYIGFRFILKQHHQWKDAVGFGLGYGTVEALFTQGFIYIGHHIFLGYHLFKGTFESFLLDQGFNLQEIAESRSFFLDNPSVFLSQGIEQIVLFIIHIFLSIVVLYSIKKSNIKYLGFAILINASIFTIVLALPTVLTSIFIVLIGIIASVLLLRFKKSIAQKDI